MIGGSRARRRCGPARSTQLVSTPTAFLGVDSLDPEIGLTTPDVLEAQLNAMMIRVAREVVVVADSSKFARRNLSLIAPLDAVHKIITDDALAPAMVTAIKMRGVEVILV